MYYSRVWNRHSPWNKRSPISNKSFHIRNLIHLYINQGIVIIFQISTCKTFRKDGPRDVKISANWHFTDNTKNPKNKILTQKITVHGDCCWQINGTVDSITKFPLKADNENSGIYSPNKHNLPDNLYIKTIKSKICD